jgi:3-deoxy-D-manno-octulosonate 8-phosphate phosphatase (KDO 8-P phosphatase)
MELLDRLTKIKMLVFDMDGVLTNGKLFVMPDGNWFRTSDIKDGFAIQLAVKSNMIVAVITGSHDIGMELRLKHLGVTEFHQQVKSKSDSLKYLINKYNLSEHEVLFMGDDIPDLEAFEVCGVSVCPADAAVELIENADYISVKTGGNGCVREIIEKVLKAQGKWQLKQSIQSI